MPILDIINLHFAKIVFAIVYCFGLYYSVLCSGLIAIGFLFGLWISVNEILSFRAGSIETKGKAVFITGCDTGFGHDLARHLDEMEFHVFAGCLYPDGDGAKKLKSASSKRLHIVPVDVCSDSSMKHAHDYVKKHLPSHGLWAVVCNAGINVVGDVEWLTLGLYQKAMNVNFYGAIRTIKSFIYLIRKNKGRVIIVSSVRGMISFPQNSAYHVTKHALESMADCLRLEMRKFGVKVSVVEPGNFSSVTGIDKRYAMEADEMWQNASTDVRSTYDREYLDATLKRLQAVTGSAMSTSRVLNAIADALVSDNPRTRYLVDGGTLFDPDTTLARYFHYIPSCLMDYTIARLTGCEHFPGKTKQKND